MCHSVAILSLNAAHQTTTPFCCTPQVKAYLADPSAFAVAAAPAAGGASAAPAAAAAAPEPEEEEDEDMGFSLFD
jgi:large subunit ribosomal protein LP0